jgi:undecaprenyl-diphosphatase
MWRWFDTGRLYGAELDRRWALALHRGSAKPRLLGLLRGCSRFGDGPMWAALLLVLPLAGGQKGLHCALLVALLGGANVLVYWGLKLGTRRLRPFTQCPDIRACVRVPDRFSFPSGHTLHAVAFAVLLSAYYPPLTPLLWAYAVLIALARVVLGVHYPSDVLVGALLGLTSGLVALAYG